MRNKASLVVAMLFAVQLGACSWVPDAVNPISWYRGVTGASKNDDLGKGQNEQNLNEGSNEPYPNLGNVPNPPDTAMSTVDRAKLADSLRADRKDARYADNQLHAGEVSATAPPPPAPTAASPAPKSEAAPAPPASANQEAAAKPAAAPVKPAAPAASRSASGKPARGTESPPAESPLASPSIKNPPQGETPMPAPPPPALSATTPPGAGTMKQAEATQAPAPPPEAAKPAAATETAASRRAVVVAFAPGSALLSDKERAAIANVANLHKAQGGRIRIVGHGESEGPNAAVTGFNLALDRAQAVSIALTEAGVPAKDIAVEAAPVAARGGRDVPRAEIYLER